MAGMIWRQEINSSLRLSFSVRCRVAAKSSGFTCRPLTKVGRPIVSAGLLFLLLFFLRLFCFSLSLFGPAELVGLGGTQLRSFLSEPPPHLQWQASITKLYPCCFHKFCNFCFSDQLRSFFCPSLVLFNWLRRLFCQTSKHSECINRLWVQALLLQINLTVLDTSKMCSPWAPRRHKKSCNGRVYSTESQWEDISDGTLGAEQVISWRWSSSSSAASVISSK